MKLTLDDQIAQIVFNAIHQNNSELPEEMYLSPKIQSVLIGPGQVWDSIGLVTFIVSVQEKISEELGINQDITIAVFNEKTNTLTVGLFIDNVKAICKQ